MKEHYDLPTPLKCYVHDSSVCDENDQDLIITSTDIAALYTDDFKEDDQEDADSLASDPLQEPTNTTSLVENNKEEDCFDNDLQDSNYEPPLRNSPMKYTGDQTSPCTDFDQSENSQPTDIKKSNARSSKRDKKECRDPAPNSFQYLMGFTKGSDYEDYVKYRKEGRSINHLILSNSKYCV